MTSEIPPSAIDPSVLASHAAWLARGRTGDGRLVVRDVRLEGSLEGADLRGSTFERVDAAGVSFAAANLDGARLSHVVLTGADLRRASLSDARLTDCDLRRARVAGLRVERSGFLRCAFGDFASQPIGKPDVLAAFAVASPDLSHEGDGSRVGHPGEVDARWFTAPRTGAERRFTFEDGSGHRHVALVLHTHVRWSREASPRGADLVTYQGFSGFLSDGAPAPYRDSLPVDLGEQMRRSVAALRPVGPTEAAIAD